MFHLASGIADWLADSLENVGVTVTGERRQDIGEKPDCSLGSDDYGDDDYDSSDGESTESSELLETSSSCAVITDSR